MRFLPVLLAVAACGGGSGGGSDAGPETGSDASVDSSLTDAAKDVAVDAPVDAPDAPDAADAGPVAFSNVRTNAELETGFVVGTASGDLAQVGCKFDGGSVVVATGTTKWKCARPSDWKIGSRHDIVAGAWDGSTLTLTVLASVYTAQNHDFDGDGWPDLAVGAPFASTNDGSVSIFYGSPSGIKTTADLTIAGPSNASMFGYALVAADFRKTGYADLAVGLASYSTSASDPGTVYVFDGGPSGLPSSSSYTVSGPTLNDASGGYSMAAGDDDGDGYQDLAVGYGAYASFNGAVYHYKGGASGVTLDAEIDGSNDFGEHVDFGDFTGSGYAALAIGGGSLTQIFAGGSSGLASSSLTTLSDVGALNTAWIKRAGGRADLVITGNAQAVVHYGDPSGFSGSTTVTDLPAYGWGTVTAGDLDLDGHDDVVFANPCLDASCTTGSALVFSGSAGGVASTASTTLDNPGSASEFAYSLGLFDLNGDGLPDLCAGTNGAYVYVFDGTGTTPAFGSTPSVTITGLSDVAFSPR